MKLVILQVSHFVKAQQVVARVHEHPDQLEALQVVYRDVHDPEVFPDRPLVKYAPEQTPLAVPIRTCDICSKVPILYDTKGSEDKIITHIQDVYAHYLSFPIT
jgi:hypothetical protein